MNLRDWLLDKRMRQKDLAIRLDVGRAYLSCVICGNRTPGTKLARNIERETDGEITAEMILSGEALGYDGNSRRAPNHKSEAFLEERKKNLSQNVFSLI